MWLILIAMFLTAAASKKQVKIDLLLVLSALIFGFFLETMGEQLGWLEFDDEQQIGGFPPSWIMALWAGMGLTFRYSNAWLFSVKVKWLMTWLACVPMTYFSASQLGAVQIDSFLFMYMSVFMGWTAYLLIVRFALNHPSFFMTNQSGENRV